MFLDLLVETALRAADALVGVVNAQVLLLQLVAKAIDLAKLFEVKLPGIDWIVAKIEEIMARENESWRADWLSEDRARAAKDAVEQTGSRE